MHALYDMWAFIELIKFHGGTSYFADIHWEFTQFLTEPQRTLDAEAFNEACRRLGMMARGYLKSTLLVAYTMWRIYRNPCIRICYATNIKDLSAQFIREIRQYFEDPWLQTYVWNARPHIAGQMIPDMDRSNRRWTNYTDSELEMTEKKVIWNNQQLQVVRPMIFKEPTIFSTSVETRLTGHHYDVVICDDIVDFLNTQTLQGIKKVQTWGDDLENVINKFVHEYSFPPVLQGAQPFTELIGNEIVYTGTRYDPQDYYAYLEANKEDFGIKFWIRNIFKNGVDNTDGYNWGEMMTAKKEAYLRKRLKKMFFPQYLNVILASVDPTFQYDAIHWVPESSIYIESIGGNGFVTVTTPEGNKDIYVQLVVDPASSLKEGSCDTAIWCLGIDDDDELWGFELRNGKYKPSETCKHLEEMMDRWKTKTITVETVGYQLALVHTIRDYMKEKKKQVVVREYLPKGDKEKRIEFWLEPHFHEATIHIHENVKSNDAFEMAVKYFGSSVPIDTIDCLAIGRETAKRRRKPQTRRLVNDYGQVIPVNFGKRSRYHKRFGGIYK